MAVLNAQLIKETEEGGYRGRMDRRVLSGRVISRNDTTRTVLLDVGASDAQGNKIFYQDVAFNPQTPPQINDLVNIGYGNSSPHSAYVSSVNVGGANVDQTVQNGGVMSIRVDGEPKLRDDVILTEGANVTLTQTDNEIEISASAGAGTPASTVTEVGSSNVVGTSTDYARADHVHRGVNSVKKTGSSEMSGDVEFDEGTGISITQTSGKLTFAATGSGGGVTARKNTGTAGGVRSQLNFIEGGNIVLTVSEDVVNDEYDVTVDADIPTNAPTGHQVNDYDGSSSSNFIYGGEVGLVGIGSIGSYDLSASATNTCFVTIWNNTSSPLPLSISGNAFLGSAGGRTDYQLAPKTTATFMFYDDGTTLSALPVGGAACGIWVNLKFSYTAFAVAATFTNITALVLPKRCIIHETIIKHSTRFLGGSTSACVAYVGTSGDPDQFCPSFDVRQTTGDQIAKHYVMYGDRPTHNWTSSENILLWLQTTGGNLNTLTQGEIEVWFLISSLP